MKKLLLTLSVVFLFTACGGGGGGGGNVSTGGVYFTHAELAREFVYRLNIDLGYDVQLVKTDTLQTDYIVVYDHDYGTYDAYWIGGYSPGQNLYNYVVGNDGYFYYDLIPDVGNTYVDPYTGIRFEKTNVNSVKNLDTIKALKQEVIVTKLSEKIQAQYGLSAEKSLETARFAYNLQTAPAGTYKNSDFDKFSQELTGSTITEFQNDIKSGNTISLAERISLAAETTGMGPEATNRLIQDLFMGNK